MKNEDIDIQELAEKETAKRMKLVEEAYKRLREQRNGQQVPEVKNRR